MACVTDAGQNSQGSEVFSTDTALTSSNSLHVSHLLQLEGPHSAGLGRTAQLPIGWMDGSHQPCQVVVHINLPRCLCSAVVAQVHSKHEELPKAGRCTKKSQVFSWWLPARSTLTWGPLRLLNDLSLQSILTGFLSIIVWTFQMRNIFQMVFHGVTHLVHFLLILYQCGACVCWISWPLVTLHAAFLRMAHSKCCTLNSDCRGFIEKLTLNLKLANTLLGISSAGMAVGMKQIGWTVLEIYKLQTDIDLCFLERCASTCQCNVFTADEPNR